MKVLNEGQAAEILKAIDHEGRAQVRGRDPEKVRARSRRKRHRARRLTPPELLLIDSPYRRRLLENQGIAPLRDSRRFPPGSRVSVQLRRCGHRARIEALICGRVPTRARCPRCHTWERVVAGSERAPQRRRAKPRVVEERTEDRDGRTFTVKVLAPRRRRAA